MASASSAFWKSFGLGVVAGMRSMSAPALLSSALRRRPSGRLAHSSLGWFQSKWAARGLKLLAGSEMLADKLPQMPDRTAPPVLAGRVVSGALVGAIVHKLNRGSLLSGAVVGGVGAVAGSYAAMSLRKLADQRTDLKEPWTGVVEDVLTIVSGKALLSGRKPGR
ncbi:DUF4126 family protein [Hymenobacter busanensis]|uniref:DUF4126 family protein n=1 Tax=Hymenobacter busanensis TaxID=2607656 RepID=A0A7L4ZXW4_9BACT|nr:DUF4126 family protein [Hymenobacter busanensis]KAA9333245.1 DUF4126 family protein [Hymenobacter busanensis]QHJ08078.1 DUF4126 family protein [Hymenobacter busanensis]